MCGSYRKTVQCSVACDYGKTVILTDKEHVVIDTGGIYRLRRDIVLFEDIGKAVLYDLHDALSCRSEPDIALVINEHLFDGRIERDILKYL